MIVSDLSYIEELQDSSIILGRGRGAYSDTFATTTAVRDYAHSSAGGLSSGDNTLVITRAEVEVGSKGRFNYSRGRARAEAYAETNDQSDRSKSISNSLLVDVNNRSTIKFGADFKASN